MLDSGSGARWRSAAHEQARAGPPPPMTAKAPVGRFPLPLDKAAPAAPRNHDATLRPQSPLQQAARDALRQHRPSGLGLDSPAVRLNLVDRLRASGACSEAVAAAMKAVPRHHFVDSALVTQAYQDTSLPIGLGQTISKPSVVARMLSLLLEGAGARARARLGSVLEIGTGCGYQTAVLAQLATRVVSIERLEALHLKARANLGDQRGHQVRLVHGDGRLGHAPNAPYDGIIAAAGGDELPAAWLAQLADGGRLVAPMHERAGAGQVLLVVDRCGDELRRTVHEAVHFVPLKSGVG